MIVLDTHIWIWWTIDPDQLSENQHQAITISENDEIGVSAISCWEVAKLCEYGRLELPVALSEWFKTALGYPGISVVNLNAGNCHRINATAGWIPSRSRRSDHSRHSKNAQLSLGNL